LNLRVGFYETALSDVNNAIKLRPSNADFYWNKGIICSMTARQTHDAGILNEAIGAFTAAIRLQPSEPKYFASRASAMMQNNDVPAALADIDRAIEMAPDDANLAAQRARIEAG
jgi:tetratricopeptide (TPR) repeat protein